MNMIQELSSFFSYSKSNDLFNGWQSVMRADFCLLSPMLHIPIASKSFANATLMIDMNN